MNRRSELVAIRVATLEGGALFASPDGRHWIQDRELAGGLAPTSVGHLRAVIRKAIAVRLLSKMGAAAPSANVHPFFRTDTEVVNTRKGKTKRATVYYLNEDAALVVLSQLGTAKAAMATGRVIRAFLALTHPELFAPDVESLRRRIGELERAIGVQREIRRALRVLAARKVNGWTDPTNVN